MSRRMNETFTVFVQAVAKRNQRSPKRQEREEGERKRDEQVDCPPAMEGGPVPLLCQDFPSLSITFFSCLPNLMPFVSPPSLGLSPSFSV
mmetsp:Transcript_30280/g.59493  ORF Transcript_30280/g.59493 Transcript_30280/m.59493 type:complete len:90 (-) Transcript_30280:1006-1275(-)